MEKKEKIIGITLLVIVLASVGLYFVGLPPFPEDYSFGLSPPGVNYISDDIQTEYSAGEKIKGTVNLSLNDALGDIVLTSNFDDANITLLDFLERNGFSHDAEFNCSTPNCLDDYIAQEEITDLEIIGGNEIAGYSISADGVTDVDSVRLSIDSTAPPACGLPQLVIDVLNDGDNLIGNNIDHNGVICSTNYEGCFDEGQSSQDIAIDSEKYCELIQLPAAPGFELSSRIKNDTNVQIDLKMLLYRFEDLSEPVGDCILPEHSDENADVYENLNCNVDYSSPAQDSYFVCVTSTSGATDYRIKFETAGEICGTNSITNFGGLTVDYDISAKSLEFGVVNDLKIDESFFETYNFELADYVQSYISERYGGACQPACSIPLEFLGVDQELQFSDIKINFSSSQGFINNDKFHSLSVEAVTVDSEELAFDLQEADFTIPIGSDEDKFEFYMDGELVFERDVNISESFDFDLNPQFVAFGQDTLFTAETIQNITNSSWDFGDGESGTANGNQISHRYLQEGEFDMEVTLTTSDGARSVKAFTIIVGDAEEFANFTLLDYRSRINTIDSQINSFPAWISTALRQEIDVPGLNATLDIAQDSYDSASSDSEYQELVLALIDLRIPSSISAGDKGDDAPLLIGFGNIDTDYIESLSGSTVEDPDALANSIATWMNTNLNPEISFEEINAFYDDGTDVILSRFKIETNPIRDIPYSYFLVLGHNIEADGTFMIDYSQSTIGGDGIYIQLDSGQANKIFEFYILSEFDVENLGAYISPNIIELGEFDTEVSPCNLNDICEKDIGEDKNNCPADCSAGRSGWFVFWIVILLFAALIVYVILQEWYKKYYEKSLFKNRNDLYNLINFIYNARKAGLKDNDVKKKLDQTGWKGEQIRYAFKKIDGERTGMYEIPIFKFMENKKVKKELAKRQGGRPVDLRFVRRRF